MRRASSVFRSAHLHVEVYSEFRILHIGNVVRASVRIDANKEKQRASLLSRASVGQTMSEQTAVGKQYPGPIPALFRSNVGSSSMPYCITPSCGDLIAREPYHSRCSFMFAFVWWCASLSCDSSDARHGQKTMHCTVAHSGASSRAERLGTPPARPTAPCETV